MFRFRRRSLKPIESDFELDFDDALDSPQDSESALAKSKELDELLPRTVGPPRIAARRS